MAGTSDGLSTVSLDCLLLDVEVTERVLGAGSYGTVFLGTWCGSRVAIKRLHSVLLLDERGQASHPFRRFLDEYSLLQKCSHPCIVQVYGMISPRDKERESPGLVMELLQSTLRERYGAEPALTLFQEVAFMLDVAGGLEFLHNRDVIHRDLTTSNILLTSGNPVDGTVRAKISDAGTAALLDVSARDTQNMTICPGSQVYMAPECLEATDSERIQYGRPADIYSLGVTMMAMINRREPPGIVSVLRHGRQGDISRIPLGHPLESMVKRCLLDSPGARPTAKELRVALTTVQGRLDPAMPASAQAESVSSQAIRLWRLADERKIQVDGLRQQLQVVTLERDQSHVETKAAIRERDAYIARCGQLEKEMASIVETVAGKVTQIETINEGTVPATKTSNTVSPLASDSRSEGAAAASSAAGMIGRLAARRSRSEDGGMWSSLLNKMRPSSRRMHAACERLFGSRGQQLRLDSRTLWRCRDMVIPEIEKMSRLPCVHNDHVYCIASLKNSKPNMAHLLQAPVDSLGESKWTSLPLPEGRWHHFSFLVSLGALLVVLLTPLDTITGYKVFFQAYNNGPWVQVDDLPERKCKFGVGVFQESLLVVGGRRSRSTASRSSRSVLSLRINSSDPRKSSWNKLPDLPCDCMGPFVVSHQGNTHLIGYTGELDHDCTQIISLIPGKSDGDYCWVMDALPRAPFEWAGATVMNDQLVLVGGKEPGGLGSKDCFLFIEDAQSWRQLPPLSFSRIYPYCFVHANRLFAFSGHESSRSNTTYEVLSV